MAIYRQIEELPTMTLFRILVILMVSFLFACTDNLKGQNLLEQNKGTRTANSQVELIELPVDMNLERETQRAVENGHQPWRLFPEQVACAVLSNRFKDTRFDDCKLESEDKGRAIASARVGKIQYRVYLERLIKTDGIWTATKIEIQK